ncbi:MAG: twin-arginine translocase TatA/TatE family subunit [Litorivicinus sp.]
MGIGGISVWQLLIILAILIMIFGTKKLRGFGGDLGGAIKGFKKAMSEEEKNTDQLQAKTETTEESVEQKDTTKS